MIFKALGMDKVTQREMDRILLQKMNWHLTLPWFSLSADQFYILPVSSLQINFPLQLSALWALKVHMNKT